MGKKNPPETPFWARLMKKRAKSKFFVVQCRGCLERITQPYWESHPLSCKNLCHNKKINLFQLQSREKLIKKQKIEKQIESIVAPKEDKA